MIRFLRPVVYGFAFLGALAVLVPLATYAGQRSAGLSPAPAAPLADGPIVARVAAPGVIEVEPVLIVGSLAR